MPKKKHLLVLLVLLFYSVTNCQSKFIRKLENNTPEDSIGYYQIKTDTLFHSRQIINLLLIHKNESGKYKVDFGWNNKMLEKTSSFGMEKNAIGAVNGSFFDVDRGGSVTYLEVNDSVISRTRNAKLKWAKPNRLINGTIVITKGNNIIIEHVKPDRYYETSKNEKGVLVAGPLLLLNGKKVMLTRMKFVTSRHPRTIFCETGDAYLFVTIDGRKKEAEGMNLIEVQKYLSDLGIADAINLDGGGSTTMWLWNKGIVNNPSDPGGERPVANVLLIEKR